MEKKTFRAFVRYGAEFITIYIQAANLEEALVHIKEEPEVREVINISEEKDTIILQ